MNALIESGYLSELACGTNFSYILSDNSGFLTTEYKVLQSQVNSSFVKCMKMLYNGKVQLYYLTKSMKSLTMMLPSLNADSFMTVVANLITDIIDVKHNGFLSCQNIDISFDRIYIDPTTLKVSLIYVPVAQRIHSDIHSFENEIRTNLVKLISGVPALSSPRSLQLASDFSNGMITMEDLQLKLKGGSASTTTVESFSTIIPGGGRREPSTGGLSLIAINAPVRIVIQITKSSFVIGKKQGMVDGVVGFNDKISRTHCRINKNGGQYTITDLQSANGTYVNRMKLQPNQPYPIKPGDIVRLANSDFKVSSV